MVVKGRKNTFYASLLFKVYFYLRSAKIKVGKNGESKNKWIKQKLSIRGSVHQKAAPFRSETFATWPEEDITKKNHVYFIYVEFVSIKLRYCKDCFTIKKNIRYLVTTYLLLKAFHSESYNSTLPGLNDSDSCGDQSNKPTTDTLNCDWLMTFKRRGNKRRRVLGVWTPEPQILFQIFAPQNIIYSNFF